MLKTLLARAQKAVRSMVEKTYVISGDAEIVANRQTLKVPLVRALKGVRNRLLETGGEQILIILCPAAMWKAELVYDEPGCRAKALSKQSGRCSLVSSSPFSSRAG